jgi:RNA polymerase sigma factor (sigma-70 family)
MRSAYPPRPVTAGNSDAELVKRAGARDEAAIRSIMTTNNRRLYRIARGILRNDGDAEDVVQETYVRAFTNLGSFRGDSSLSTWLARIAMNEALGRLRRQRPSVDLSTLAPGVLEAQIIQFPLSVMPDDPEKSMAQREIQHIVEHAIDELPEAFRIVFITRDRGDECRGNRRHSRPEAGNRQNQAAPRPRPVARQRREENRAGGDGGVSICRQALRTSDRRGSAAARPEQIIFRNLCTRAPSNPVCHQQCRAVLSPGATGVSKHVPSIERGARRG